MQAVATREERLFINGEWTGAADGKTYSKRNPYTGGTASQVPAGKREDARRAIEAAAAAFPAWSATPPAARRALLLKAADVLERRMQDISKIMAAETGQTFGWGMFNCIYTAGILREASAQPYAMVGEVIPTDLPDTTAMAMRVPVGVVVGIAPWNAPMILGMRAVAAPVAYGNTVVLKASESSPANIRSSWSRAEATGSCSASEASRRPSNSPRASARKSKAERTLADPHLSELRDCGVQVMREGRRDERI
jgi:vanillin dehydrogenase